MKKIQPSSKHAVYWRLFPTSPQISGGNGQTAARSQRLHSSAVSIRATDSVRVSSLAPPFGFHMNFMWSIFELLQRHLNYQIWRGKPPFLSFLGVFKHAGAKSWLVTGRGRCCWASRTRRGCGVGVSLLGKLDQSDSGHCRRNKDSDLRKAEWLESASLLIIITLAQESPRQLVPEIGFLILLLKLHLN